MIRRSKLHYTASGIITLKKVGGLKLLKYNSINMSNFFPMPPHVLVDFVVFPPGHGRSVTDF